MPLTNRAVSLNAESWVWTSTVLNRGFSFIVKGKATFTDPRELQDFSRNHQYLHQFCQNARVESSDNLLCQSFANHVVVTQVRPLQGGDWQGRSGCYCTSLAFRKADLEGIPSRSLVPFLQSLRGESWPFVSHEHVLAWIEQLREKGSTQRDFTKTLEVRAEMDGVGGEILIRDLGELMAVAGRLPGELHAPKSSPIPISGSGSPYLKACALQALLPPRLRSATSFFINPPIALVELAQLPARVHYYLDDSGGSQAGLFAATGPVSRQVAALRELLDEAQASRNSVWGEFWEQDAVNEEDPSRYWDLVLNWKRNREFFAISDFRSVEPRRFAQGLDASLQVDGGRWNDYVRRYSETWLSSPDRLKEVLLALLADGRIAVVARLWPHIGEGVLTLLQPETDTELARQLVPLCDSNSSLCGVYLQHPMLREPLKQSLPKHPKRQQGVLAYLHSLRESDPAKMADLYFELRDLLPRPERIDKRDPMLSEVTFSYLWQSLEVETLSDARAEGIRRDRVALLHRLTVGDLRRTMLLIGQHTQPEFFASCCDACHAMLERELRVDASDFWKHAIADLEGSQRSDAARANLVYLRKTYKSKSRQYLIYGAAAGVLGIVVAAVLLIWKPWAPETVDDMNYAQQEWEAWLKETQSANP